MFKAFVPSHPLYPMSPSGPCLELRDKFLQLTTSGSLEHLDFAPDQAGWQVAGRGLSSGGNSSGSQAVEAAIWVQRTIVPPKPTVPRPAPGLNAGVGALCFPGAAALARDTRGPTIFVKYSTNFLFFTICVKMYSTVTCQPSHVVIIWHLNRIMILGEE